MYLTFLNKHTCTENEKEIYKGTINSGYLLIVNWSSFFFLLSRLFYVFKFFYTLPTEGLSE